MINWINSHKQAIKYIWGITKNNNSDNKFHDEKYDGIKNKPTPLRIFKSKNPKSTTFIIFPGASPFAEEHPGMIKLATAILNLGYNVFIPRIPPLKKLNITDENIEWFIKAYIEIINRKDVDKNNISVVGISFGGSILLKAILPSNLAKLLPAQM